MDVEERFFRHIQRVPAVDGTEHWIWIGAQNAYGKGRFTVEGRTVTVASWSYRHFVGDVPPDCEVVPICDAGSFCVQPDHLRPLRRNERGRKKATMCCHGHALTSDNIIIVAGTRRCRTCQLISNAAYREKRRQLAIAAGTADTAWASGFCKKGHDITLKENIITIGKSRRCRICNSERSKKFREQSKEERRRVQLREVHRLLRSMKRNK